MEEQLLRLIKAVLDHTVKADYGTSETDDQLLIGSILEQADLALHPWAEEELAEYVGLLHRPF